MQMVEESRAQPNWIAEALLPWVVCVSASLFFFYEFIQGNMFASIADNIMQDFHIQADRMTYLSSCYYLANVLFLFVAGSILDRYATKKMILIAMAISVLSTFLFAHAHSFYFAICCRFMTGIGSAFCFLGPVRLASHWFPPRRMAMVTGIIVTIAMSGGMIAQYPMAALANHLGWRDALTQVGWFGVGIFLVMFFGIIEKGPMHVHHQQKTKNAWLVLVRAYCDNQNIRAALYTSLMNMAIAVFGAMMGALYLMQRLSIPKEEAALINSFLFLGVIVGGPVIGYISDKLGLRVLPMKWGALLSLIVVLAVLFLPVSVAMMKVLFFLLGFFTAAQVISYALVAEGSHPNLIATSVGVVSVLTQGGYIIYQNLFSTLLIHHGDMHLINNTPVYSLSDYNFAALILPIGLLIALLNVWGLKETFARQTQG